ncbi:Tim10/DDP family zinc finger-domain-containing protein [Ephemerocybe angulata]|nr:Tim10/DDP family zinc finger-domain-containing protein [Tulosesus angulatus]KAF6757088.1 Tim10/DDP family zinc finger-domain-containing protein [Tulosesus angulatus]
MESRKQAVMQHIRNETALTNAQELMNASTERCFKSCVVNPGTSLSSTEQACLSGCFDKYLEAFTVVSRAYAGRVRSELGPSQEEAKPTVF